MSQFLIVLHNDPANWMKLSPEDMQKAVEKYNAWREKPFTLDGKRLFPNGRVVRSDSGTPRTTDGPYTEAREIIGGLYLIEAADYDEAVRRTFDHPHLQYGGTLEVRQLWGQ